VITETMLRQLWPHGDSKIPGLIAGIAAAAPTVFPKYGLMTDHVVAQAMAQFSHECGAGTEMTENTRYTAERAAQVWPNRFRDATDCYEKVGSYPGDPDFAGKLIDVVYGSRMGNRPGTHDGRTYIGRGLSQLTGRENYAKLGDKLGLDLINQPDLVNAPARALEVGVADFVMCGCLPWAEKDDTVEVTKHLNGGTVGLAERQQWLERWKKALATDTLAKPIQQPAPAPAKVHPKAVASAGVVVAGGAAAQQAHQAGASPTVVALIVAATIVAALVMWYAIHRRSSSNTGA